MSKRRSLSCPDRQTDRQTHTPFLVLKARHPASQYTCVLVSILIIYTSILPKKGGGCLAIFCKRRVSDGLANSACCSIHVKRLCSRKKPLSLKHTHTHTHTHSYTHTHTGTECKTLGVCQSLVRIRRCVPRVS